MRFKSRYQPSMDVPFVYLASSAWRSWPSSCRCSAGPRPRNSTRPRRPSWASRGSRAGGRRGRRRAAVAAPGGRSRRRGQGDQASTRESSDLQGGGTTASLLEKLRGAVNALASGSRSIQEQVADAWISALCRLEANDFPPELRDAFQALSQEATRHGNFEATAAKMAVDQAHGHADRIVALYTHLLEKY